MDRQRAFAQHRDALAEAVRLRIGAAHGFLHQALRAHAADAMAHRRIGQQAAFGQAQQAGGGLVHGQFQRVGTCVHGSCLAGDFGNQGNSIGVVRWYSR